MNHILPKPVFTTILDDSESLGLRTKEGTAYFMKKHNGTKTIGKATVSMADILATDSVIHIMDEVLIPTSGESFWFCNIQGSNRHLQYTMDK